MEDLEHRFALLDRQAIQEELGGGQVGGTQADGRQGVGRPVDQLGQRIVAPHADARRFGQHFPGAVGADLQGDVVQRADHLAIGAQPRTAFEPDRAAVLAQHPQPVHGRAGLAQLATSVDQRVMALGVDEGDAGLADEVVGGPARQRRQAGLTTSKRPSREITANRSLAFSKNQRAASASPNGEGASGVASEDEGLDIETPEGRLSDRAAQG
jgi:hypothetical protein